MAAQGATSLLAKLLGSGGAAKGGAAAGGSSGGGMGGMGGLIGGMGGGGKGGPNPAGPGGMQPMSTPQGQLAPRQNQPSANPFQSTQRQYGGGLMDEYLRNRRGLLR